MLIELFYASTFTYLILGVFTIRKGYSFYKKVLEGKKLEYLKSMLEVMFFMLITIEMAYLTVEVGKSIGIVNEY